MPHAVRGNAHFMRRCRELQYNCDVIPPGDLEQLGSGLSVGVGCHCYLRSAVTSSYWNTCCTGILGYWQHNSGIADHSTTSPLFWRQTFRIYAELILTWRARAQWRGAAVTGSQCATVQQRGCTLKRNACFVKTYGKAPQSLKVFTTKPAERCGVLSIYACGRHE